MDMQHLAINRTGTYRKATLNGKAHYVVPVAMIVPGVLPGSKGKLLYPAEEVAKNPDAWNGMPLVVTHPIVNGKAVSARSATILDSHGVGVVLNSHINRNGKLVAEGWFDVEKANQIDSRIISKIERGEQIELSTGLFTDNIPVKNVKEAIHNGKPYTHIARNYRPDHLAILLDEQGACSIKDGCGVGVLNAASSRKDASKLRPKSEKCNCGGKGACKCKPGNNLSPEKEPTENELSYSELHTPLEKNLSARFPGAYLNEVYRDYIIFRYAGNLYQLGYSIDKKSDVVSFDSEMPTIVRKVVTFKPVELPSGVAVTNTEAAKMILNESWFKICPRKNGRCLPKPKTGASGTSKGKAVNDKAAQAGAKTKAVKAKSKTAKKEAPVKTIAGEAVTPPATKNPSLRDTIPGKGKAAKAARVGVSGDEVPPPPKITKLPNLTKTERKVEREFINAYEKDPDAMANKLRKMLKKTTKPGEPLTFGTDDAKVLHKAWGNKKMSLEDRSKNRATLNCALHQTANAVTKRAFVQHLNTLKKGDEVMVTVGGCGAGKGYALKNVPKALEMKKKSKAVWDSAGDQNATENAWIQKEAEKRGLKVNYVFVDADPKVQWAHPDRGVVKRAQDPNDGRMVDAKVFADSYAYGAKNHQAFYEKNKNNKNANFIFLENGSNPKEIPGIPKERLRQSAKKLADFAIETVAKNYDIPPHVRRGATIGTRIWPEGLTANSLLGAAQFIINASDSQEFDDDEEYQEGLDRLNEMADMADDEGFQVGSEPEFDLDENGVEITDDEPTENSSDPLDGLSDTTKAHLILTENKKKNYPKVSVTPEKACKIVKDGTIHGKPISEAQQGLFGAKCGQRKKKKPTQNVFSDEARAAALLARKKMGEAAGAVGKAGKAAVVSGVKAAGGAAKAGLKRTGQAYKEVAKSLLEKLKAKLGIKSKPVKMAKDKTATKQADKAKAQTRQQKLREKLKANKEALLKRKADRAAKKATRKAVRSKIKTVVKQGKANKRSKQVASYQSKKAEKKTALAKASREKKNAAVKSKVAAAKKPSSVQDQKSARYQKDGAKTKAGKRLTQADLDKQKTKTSEAKALLSKQQDSMTKSKEKLDLAKKIAKANAATRKKERGWDI